MFFGINFSIEWIGRERRIQYGLVQALVQVFMALTHFNNNKEKIFIAIEFNNTKKT